MPDGQIFDCGPSSAVEAKGKLAAHHRALSRIFPLTGWSFAALQAFE
jgi:hypothetical protein